MGEMLVVVFANVMAKLWHAHCDVFVGWVCFGRRPWTNEGFFPANDGSCCECFKS